MHQGSAFSLLLLFVIVMDAISREIRDALPWELLYADNLAAIVESEGQLIKKQAYLMKDGMDVKGVKFHMNKTKVMISEESCKGYEYWRWPHSVCGRFVGRNSVLCTNCQK